MTTTEALQGPQERDRGHILVLGAAVGLAVLGCLAFVLRPVFPAPVDEVSTWVRDGAARGAWDRLYLARATISVLRPAVLVALVATPPGRRLLHRGTSWMSGSTVGAILAPVNVLVAVDLLMLPVAWWGRLSREPASTWIADWVVAHAQDWALVAILAAGLVFGMRRWRSSWHWRVALAGIALAALVPLAADLDPFVGDLAPLPNGPVRDAVEAGAAAAGADDIPLRVGFGAAAMENAAYVTGIGPGRTMVLSAGLLSFPPEQIAFVAMHEFAHREHLDIHRKVLATAPGLVIGLWALRSLLSSAWGQEHLREAEAPQVRKMIIALTLAAVASQIAAPISNLATRQSEAAADWRALEITGDPVSSVALQRYLLDEGLADSNPPAWYQNWLASHPSARFRIGLAERYAKLNGIPLPSGDASGG